jgi:hypothetical protein
MKGSFSSTIKYFILHYFLCFEMSIVRRLNKELEMHLRYIRKGGREKGVGGEAPYTYCITSDRWELNHEKKLSYIIS